MKQSIKQALRLFTFILPWFLNGQQVIVLPNCGETYFDPQDQNAMISTGRDTLLHQAFFNDSLALRTFYVDINAFGGQQIDRTAVYAIMQDSSLKPMGTMAFGNCLSCVEGFAFMHNDSLYATEVTDPVLQDLWINSFGQPPFSIAGSLQTPVGVGRISGTFPYCAIGYQVVYVVNSNPNNATTEFSTHIICPEIVRGCDVLPQAEVDCQAGEVVLRVELPQDCFPPDASIFWEDQSGNTFDGAEVIVPFFPTDQWYYINIQDDCCLQIDSIFVQNTPFADAGEDQTLCLSTPLLLNASGGVSYEWGLPNQTQVTGAQIELGTTSLADGGPYIVSVTDERGCLDLDTVMITINEPHVPDFEVTNVCYGETLDFLVTNENLFSQIDWIDPTGVLIDNNQIQNFQPINEGMYNLMTTDTNNCVFSQLVEVEGSRIPDFEVDYIEQCTTVTAILYPEDYDYLWENGVSGNQLEVSGGGSFQLSITDDKGCSNETIINIPRPGGDWYDLIIDQPICPGDYGRIEVAVASASRPLIFSIDGGETYTLSSEFKKLEPGSYELAVLDEFGCEQRESIVLNQPIPLSVLLEDTVIIARPNELIELNATLFGSADTIQWLPKEIDSGTLSTSFPAHRDMDVRVIVQDDNGCHVSDGLKLSVILSPIHAPNAFTPNFDGKNDGFTLYSDLRSGEQIERLLIFDRYGNVVFEGTELPMNVPELGWDGNYQNQKMNPGIYVYQATVRFGNGIKKVVSGDVALIR